MGIALRTEALAHELARRGWTCADLAKAAGLSGATVVSARAGKAVSARSLRLMARALAMAPPIEGIDSLLL